MKEIDPQYSLKNYSIVKGLNKNRILQSKKLQRDYAKWLAIKLLNLELASNKKGFDALDSQKKSYKIKFRCVNNISENTSFDVKDTNIRFDHLVGIFFDQELNVLGIILTDYDTFKKLGVRNKESLRFRWNEQISEDTRVERLEQLIERKM